MIPDLVVSERVKYQPLPFICSSRSLMFEPRQKSIRAMTVVFPRPFRESVFVASFARSATTMLRPSRNSMARKPAKLAVKEFSRMSYLPLKHAGIDSDNA